MTSLNKISLFAITLATIAVFGGIMPFTSMSTMTKAQTNETNSVPILGGIANLNTVQDDTHVAFTITKNAANNETTVISQNGTVTEVPGGNVTVVDNGTVVVAPDNSTITTTPGNTTVIEPPRNETVTPVQPCNCNQSQPTIPNVVVTPAPGQNVTTQAPPETPIPTPIPLPPIENNTNTNTNTNNTIPGNGGVVGPEAGGNTTNTNNTGQ